MAKILTSDEVRQTVIGMRDAGTMERCAELGTRLEIHDEALRDLLRRVMEAPCDTSDGEYGTRPVREAMGPGFRGWSTTGEKNAALRAEVDAALEVEK